LRSVLGQRTGYEDSKRAKETSDSFEDNPVQLHPRQNNSINDGHGIEALKRADRSFSEPQFMDGAQMAFGMILTAYAEGDLAQLKRLLGYDLLQSFTQSIQQRARDKETLVINLEKIKQASIIDAKVFDNVASVTVEFRSVQTRTITDDDGNVIDDEDTGTLDLVDIWTFERDLTLDDPNWKLAETESPDSDA